MAAGKITCTLVVAPKKSLILLKSHSAQTQTRFSIEVLIHNHTMVAPVKIQ